MNLRNFIFRFTRKYLRFLPDSTYLRLQYWGFTGRKLNLRNPRRFTEKIQWLKIHDRKPVHTDMVDKAKAKDWVKSRIDSKYLIPTIGVYDSWEAIDFSRLPQRFVIKTTHGGGSTGVVVVENKAKLNNANARQKILHSLANQKATPVLREYQYKDIEGRILIEQYIEPDLKGDLEDYKFFCFNGEPRFCQVIRDRNTQETIDFYDMNWHHQPFVGLNPDVSHGATPVAKPECLEEMIDICRKLSKDEKFLRVDLYYAGGKILFGEVTLHPATGLGFFNPDEYDLILGDLLDLNKN